MSGSNQASHPISTLILLRVIVLTLIALLLLLVAFLSWPEMIRRFHRDPLPAAISTSEPSEPTPEPSHSATPTLPFSEPMRPSASDTPIEFALDDTPAASDAAFLSVIDGGHAHLFAFLPDRRVFIRLTMGDWDDITPAVSPDGSKLAFASNRSGRWDLYIMNLQDGSLEPLTNTPEYEASPSWSPDGLWLAYEAYLPDEQGGGLEIFIRPLDTSQEPVRLTSDPAADFSPAWSPQGRRIAFVSSRTGDLEIWQADLDKTRERFTNLSQDPDLDDRRPAWSPVGDRLVWSSAAPGEVESLRIWDPANPNLQAARMESGTWPAFGRSSDQLLSIYRTPNKNYLSGVNPANREALMPLIPLSGDIQGLSWGHGRLSRELLADIGTSAQLTLPAPWVSNDQGPLLPDLRSSIVILDGVQAPLAMLQNQADESFLALRSRVAKDAGWDFMSILEQAYVPLTSPLDPGFGRDWLYTGRAVKFNPAPLNAGWLVIVRENFGPETYWRVYLRARMQNGSQGVPLQQLPFDLSARHSGDPRAYEDGGLQVDAVPAGFWIDFTRLASAFGWERLPALSSWKIGFSGVRYNEYVFRQGLDWMEAMLQVYPLEALLTPTPVSSPTMTPTPTDTPTLTPTLTRTRYISPTPTPSLTRRPTATFTPRPPKD